MLNKLKKSVIYAGLAALFYYLIFTIDTVKTAYYSWAKVYFELDLEGHWFAGYALITLGGYLSYYGLKSIYNLRKSFVYAFLAIFFYYLIFTIDAVAKTYNSWVKFYLDSHLFVQYGLIMLSGYLSYHVLKKVGAYSVEFDLTSLKKTQHSALSVVRAAVTISLALWLLVFKSSDIHQFSFSNLISAFCFFYLGGMLFETNFVKYYAKHIKSIWQHHDLFEQGERFVSNNDAVEAPIKFVDQDKYQRVHVARRLADKLMGFGDNKESFRRIALVSGFGMGKSSTLNMVEQLIIKEQSQQNKNQSERWVFVHFDAWGKEKSSTNIQGQLLEAIIGQITKHIETTSLRGLPSEYLAALQGLHSSTKMLTHFASIPLSVSEQLTRLNNLLKKHRIKVCIFIEDMDRNDEALAATNAIAPLLNNLKDTSQIQFVFTLGYSEGASDILSRVTDYREDLPPIDFKNELAVVLNKQYAKLKGNDQIPFIGKSDLLDGMKHTTRASAFEDACKLIASPRNFSAIRREIDSKWAFLIGEFNLDDLVILSIFKVAQPVVFDFISVNYAELRDANSNNDQELKGRWEKLAENINGDVATTSKLLVEQLFPQWQPKQNRKLQSVASNEAKDYWMVYMKANSNMAYEYKDQDIYSEMLQLSESEGVPKFDTSIPELMFKYPEFINFITSLIQANKDSFTAKFWQQLLRAIEVKGDLLRGLSFDDNTAYNHKNRMVEALIKVVKVVKNEEDFKRHIEWGMKTSLIYVARLANHNALKHHELNIKEIVTSAFIEFVDNQEHFDKLVTGFEGKANDFERKIVKFLRVFDNNLISKVEKDEYEISDIQKKLHRLLFDYALKCGSEEDLATIYNYLLFKDNFEQHADGSLGNVRRFDYGAKHLMSEKNEQHLLERLEDPAYGSIKEELNKAKVSESIL